MAPIVIPLDARQFPTVQALREIKTLPYNGGTTAGKTLVLYTVRKGFENVSRLVSGDTVGLDLSYMMSPDSLSSLASPDSYLLKYDPVIDKNKCVYELFVGNMHAFEAHMLRQCYTAEDALYELGKMKRTHPEYPHAYTMKFTLNNVTEYTPLFGV